MSAIRDDAGSPSTSSSISTSSPLSSPCSPLDTRPTFTPQGLVAATHASAHSAEHDAWANLLGRRQFHRAHCAVEVRYQSESLSFRGRSVDLSPSGLLLLTPLCDLVGTLAQVTLSTGGHAPLTVPCQVVRVSRGRHPGMALVFLDLAEPQRRSVAELWAQMLDASSADT